MKKMASVRCKIIKVVCPVFLPTLVSNGMRGEALESALWNSKRRESEITFYIPNQQFRRVSLLKLPEYTTTSGIKYKPVVIRGIEFTDQDRNLSNVRILARALEYKIPPIELVGLLALSDERKVEEEEGCFGGLVVMHEPITYRVPPGFKGGRKQLMLYTDGTGKYINEIPVTSEVKLDEKVGFVFLSK